VQIKRFQFVCLVILATTIALLYLCVSFLYALPIPPKTFHSSQLRSKLINYPTVKSGISKSSILITKSKCLWYVKPLTSQLLLLKNVSVLLHAENNQINLELCFDIRPKLQYLQTTNYIKHLTKWLRILFHSLIPIEQSQVWCLW
jgi:hypothetical protein